MDPVVAEATDRQPYPVGQPVSSIQAKVLALTPSPASEMGGQRVPSAPQLASLVQAAHKRVTSAVGSYFGLPSTPCSPYIDVKPYPWSASSPAVSSDTLTGTSLPA